MKGVKITGYVDRWSYRPGETAQFFVSTAAKAFTARLLRLIHADENPAGPGLKTEHIPAPLEDSYAGEEQSIQPGSCVVIPSLPALSSFSVAMNFFPTLCPHTKRQGLLSVVDESSDTRIGVSLLESGRVALEFWQQGAVQKSATTKLALGDNRWHSCALSYDSTTRVLRLDFVESKSFKQGFTDQHSLAFSLDEDWSMSAGSSVLLGAEKVVSHLAGSAASQSFNGKIDTPLLFSHALAPETLTALTDYSGKSSIESSAIGAWNFVESASTHHVPDRSGNELHAWLLHRPTRLVPGLGFTGATQNPFELPHEFNAVHLHDDDLEDCYWHPSVVLELPDSLASGIYALEVVTEEGSDLIPFAVRPNRDEAKTAIAFLMPTVSYQVYANSALTPELLPESIVPLKIEDPQPEYSDYCQANQLRSLYDTHNDGHGIALATMRRPMLHNVRPATVSTFNGGPHQLGADLHLIDWLEEKEIPYQVVTDHDLDREGVAALAPYRCVLSGTHHEYWTRNMLQALESYTDSGGRFMYLSGNGLYWVTALTEDGNIVEVRRDNGTRSWTTERGSGYMSLTSEQGGIWAWRGLAPQKYVGVGFAAQGFDEGKPYLRTEDSHDSRVEFVFEGVAGDLIGDVPALVSHWGAAGYEIDRADYPLGTPSHAIVLATARGFSDSYQLAVEECPAMSPLNGGTTHPDVRADLVFYETPNQGAVFSTGSISWCSCLSYNDYDNDVSQITENVARAFSQSGPLPAAITPTKS